MGFNEERVREERVREERVRQLAELAGITVADEDLPEVANRFASLMDELDFYDPEWVSRFNTLRDAAEHYGLMHMLEEDPDEEDYAPLDFN